MHADVSELILFKRGMMINTTEHYILILLSVTFIEGHRVRNKPSSGYLSKFSVHLDGIWCAVKNGLRVEPYFDQYSVREPFLDEFKTTTTTTTTTATAATTTNQPTANQPTNQPTDQPTNQPNKDHTDFYIPFLKKQTNKQKNLGMMINITRFNSLAFKFTVVWKNKIVCVHFH